MAMYILCRWCSTGLERGISAKTKKDDQLTAIKLGKGWKSITTKYPLRAQLLVQLKYLNAEKMQYCFSDTLWCRFSAREILSFWISWLNNWSCNYWTRNVILQDSESKYKSISLSYQTQIPHVSQLYPLISFQPPEVPRNEPSYTCIGIFYNTPNRLSQGHCISVYVQ